MKIIISCGGKWGTFFQAEALLKLGCLEKIITGYPKFKLKAELRRVPEGKVVSFGFSQIACWLINAIPFIGNRIPGRHRTSAVFDYFASRRLEGCDIFIGWASYSLKSMRKAKSYGAITVLERGSSHILCQKELVEEEYKIWGMKRKFTDRWTVERSLQEYNEADYIVLQSEFAYQSFVLRGFQPDKLLKIPLGIDTGYFKDILKEDDIFRVIFVGSLSLRKGIPYLLEAVSSLHLDNFELILIGGVSDEVKGFLRKYAGKYRYIGNVFHQELYKYYSQSSVFVLPSVEEGFGQVIPEAMACGLPVVTTVNTCGPDLIRDGIDGFLIPIRNVKILREKILVLYENEGKRRQMGVSAKKRAAEFTWDRWAQDALRCYQKLLLKGREGIRWPLQKGR